MIDEIEVCGTGYCAPVSYDDIRRRRRMRALYNNEVNDDAANDHATADNNDSGDGEDAQ